MGPKNRGLHLTLIITESCWTCKKQSPGMQVVSRRLPFNGAFSSVGRVGTAISEVLGLFGGQKTEVSLANEKESLGKVVALFTDRDAVSDCVMSAMRNAQKYFRDTLFLGDFSCNAIDSDDRFATQLMAYGDVGPLNSFCPTSAQSFESCFFGCPPSSVMLIRCFSGTAIRDFMRSKNTVEKQLTMFVDHFTNPRAFDDVSTEADNSRTFR
jgi:hypothetical protein